MTPGAPPGPPSDLPPLALRCRPVWRLLYGAAALALFVLGSDALVEAVHDPAADMPALATAPILLLAGAGCAYFTARYGLATLVLDDTGFRLAGPLGSDRVEWIEVIEWSRFPRHGGFGILRVVAGTTRRRVTVPLIYEDAHLLELGLAQRRFPRY
ncbi:MAG: hypothetical protein ACRD5D_07470 [Candidatus Polarisedimenticolia bacterium]